MRAKVLLVLAIPLCPLLASAALVSVVARQAQASQATVAQTLALKSELAMTLSLLMDGEVALRGFLLTRDAESLEPFHKAATRLPEAFDRLRTLAAGDAAQLRQLDVIEEFEANRPLVQHVLGVRTTGVTAPPLDLLRLSRNRNAQLRDVVLGMERHADARLAAAVSGLATAQDRLARIAWSGAGLGLVGGVFAAVALTSGVVRRTPQNDELLAESGRGLEQARRALDHFFSVSLDLLCMADMNGRFIRVNPAWEETLGWRQEDLTSVPYLDFVHPDDLEATQGASAQLANGQAVMTFENRYRCRDGSYRWLQWKAAPSEGVVIAAARDVTEQRRAAAELRARVSELADVNHELEAFSYSVSHDLRAPLRHISGFAMMIDRSAASRLDADERRRLRVVIDGADQMGRLIDDLLSFSRMNRTTPSRQRVDLSELVRDVRRDLVSANERGVEWEIAALPVVYGDPTLLRLVFSNLLGNALKYSRPNPVPRIEIGSEPGSQDQAVIYVRDNGVGFDMQYAHKLFGVFQRLHGADEFEGTGIGLASVRRIVERHGGRAWAEGAVNRGATFRVSLPTVEAMSA